MASLNWTDQSIVDLTNIADFIAKDSVRYAKVTINRLNHVPGASKSTLALAELSPKLESMQFVKLLWVITGSFTMFFLPIE